MIMKIKLSSNEERTQYIGQLILTFPEYNIIFSFENLNCQVCSKEKNIYVCFAVIVITDIKSNVMWMKTGDSD
jgi:hypothetical protein